MGAVVGRGAEEKGIELRIDHFGPSSLEQHWQQTGWRLDSYWHRQLSEERLASTHADVVLMFTDCFPLEWFREKEEDVDFPSAGSAICEWVGSAGPGS